jgi:hypothetical protein
VFDCSFLPKSGIKTWDMDRFFSWLAGRTQNGLEVSILGVVTTESHRAFGGDARHANGHKRRSTPHGFAGPGTVPARLKPRRQRLIGPITDNLVKREPSPGIADSRQFVLRGTCLRAR